MANSRGPRRQRGSIDTLPSGARRVRVYAGRDPVSKRELYLSEIVTAGPRADREAEKVRTRLLHQVDEKRSPRSRATLGHLVDRWLEVHDGDPSTVRAYESKVRRHIRPLLGDLSLTRIDTEVLDSFYAELRRCREHCDGKSHVEHRTAAPHVCDEHLSVACSPPDPACCHACRRICKPHECKGLGNSTVRQIHWILSGALDRAVTWRWISVNPAEHADKPSLPHPDPRPPTAEEAARLVDRAWSMGEDWGAFIWTKMTIGARRGEMCGLHWHDVDVDKSMLTIRRTIYVDDDNNVQEKDTKTHQQRRIVVDPETLHVLNDLQARARDRSSQLGYALPKAAYVFSPIPDGSVPLLPDTATQRYKRMANRLGIDTTLKNLRHYSATELIHAGVDARIVAGRLGHGGGGSTTPSCLHRMVGRSGSARSRKGQCPNASTSWRTVGRSAPWGHRGGARERRSCLPADRLGPSRRN